MNQEDWRGSDEMARRTRPLAAKEVAGMVELITCYWVRAGRGNANSLVDGIVCRSEECFREGAGISTAVVNSEMLKCRLEFCVGMESRSLASQPGNFPAGSGKRD